MFPGTPGVNRGSSACGSTPNAFVKTCDSCLTSETGSRRALLLSRGSQVRILPGALLLNGGPAKLTPLRSHFAARSAPFARLCVGRNLDCERRSHGTPQGRYQLDGADVDPIGEQPADTLVTQVLQVPVDLAHFARSTRAPGFTRFVSCPLATSSRDSQAVLKLPTYSPIRSCSPLASMNYGASAEDSA